MAKKKARKVRHHKPAKAGRTIKSGRTAEDAYVMVQGWMFVVAFALMLGVGAIVGTFVNRALSESPTVAGASISR
ncbi:hypothetical protein A2Z33_03785 [Candidatus Gottesmanbacteria bacterium RBG_16_52_11]|uniref:Uncharacterized protein n=1 Tax=Candidatus Gottesmanbacteria bacterium RBG_16_52_11 TaxID=1798374 RepID=A0A1F5YVY8_9BACT|nr:MAG: hypothetical protein A2Z33_03785 [Candidatus Gottesmanbacteria bacterium RBG_16_52_11]